MVHVGFNIETYSVLWVLSNFRPITDPAYEDVNNAFERSLVFMHKVKMVPVFLPLFFNRRYNIKFSKRPD